MRKFNLKEFSAKINNYDNFNTYDEVIKYTTSEEDLKNKSYNHIINDYIEYFLTGVLYGIDLKNISSKSLLEKVNQEYEQEIARQEFTDRQVDIYYYEIYKSCSIFSGFVNDAKDEGLAEGDIDLDKLIQIGQYYAYDQLNNMIYNELLEYLEANID